MGRVWELVLILAIILIFFGAGKLPQIMKDVGKSIKGLKDGMKEDKKKDSKILKEKNKKKQ
jgi:sec-independent protein translocase protein TatA